MFVKIFEGGKFAFPLEDYPKTADGSYYTNFRITYIHKCPFGIPYYKSTHEVSLVPLGKYAEYIKSLISKTRIDGRTKLSATPYVAVNPDDWNLYFDPLS